MNAGPAVLAEENAELQRRMIALAAEENADRITAPLRELDAAEKKLGTPKTPEGQMARIYIEQAATLGDEDYEAARKNLAKNAGMRASVLDAERAKLRPHEESSKQGEPLTFIPTEPWPEAVNAADLIKDIAVLVRRHVILSPDDAVAVSLWIAATYFSDVIDYAPILGITSPTMRCGKSTLLAVLMRMVLRPIPSSNISGPMVFRVITQCQPTFLIDEADSFLPENEALRGIINSGQARDFAFTIRGVGEDFEPRKFSTWGLKAIACIGKLPGTIADRTLHIHMERKAKSEHIEKLRATAPEKFETLRRKLTRFAADKSEAVKASRPAIPDELNDREADTWGPLFAIADLAGQKWGDRARGAAQHMKSDDADANDMAVQLLHDAYLAFKSDEKLATKSLIELLCSDSEKPWLTYNRGNPISPRQVAAKLRAFGIVPDSVRTGDHTPKGYKKADFERLLPKYPFPSATPPQTNNGAASGDFQSATAADVLRIEKPPQPNAGAACGGVADKTAGGLEL